MRLLRQFANARVLLRRNDKVVVNPIFTKDITNLALIAEEILALRIQFVLLDCFMPRLTDCNEKRERPLQKCQLFRS